MMKNFTSDDIISLRREVWATGDELDRVLKHRSRTKNSSPVSKGISKYWESRYVSAKVAYAVALATNKAYHEFYMGGSS